MLLLTLRKQLQRHIIVNQVLLGTSRDGLIADSTALIQHHQNHESERSTHTHTVNVNIIMYTTLTKKS